jgi:hypothetical protein
MCCVHHDHAHARPPTPTTHRFQRGLKRKPLALVKKLRKAKMEASQGEQRQRQWWR